MKRLMPLLVFGPVVISMMNCGDGSSPSMPSQPRVPAPAPTVLVTTVIGEDSTFLPTHTFRLQRGTIGARGELKANIDWSVAEASLQMYLTDGTCTSEKFQRDVCPYEPACECKFLERSETAGPKPRRLRVPNFGPGEFTFIVWNVGDVDTASSWQLLLTTISAMTLRAVPASRESASRESRIEGSQTVEKRGFTAKGAP